jgi:hypothetical protein
MSWSTEIFFQEINIFCLLAKSFSFLKLAFRKLHLLLLKILITTTTAVNFPVFAVSIAISSALVVTLGAVLVTLIGRGWVVGGPVQRLPANTFKFSFWMGDLTFRSSLYTHKNRQTTNREANFLTQ